MTLDTVPTETPAARATSLIPTDWVIGQRPPGERAAAGRPSHYRRPAAQQTGQTGAAKSTTGSAGAGVRCDGELGLLPGARGVPAEAEGPAARGALAGVVRGARA